MAERRAWESVGGAAAGQDPAVAPDLSAPLEAEESSHVAVKFSVTQLVPTNLERQEATGVLALSFDGTLGSMDVDGEAMLPEHVYELARLYMLQGRIGGHDVQHDRTSDVARLVEIFFNDERIASPKFPPLSVVVTLRYHDAATWEQVKAGTLTGFSFECDVVVRIGVVEMVIPADRVRLESA